MSQGREKRCARVPIRYSDGVSPQTLNRIDYGDVKLSKKMTVDTRPTQQIIQELMQTRKDEQHHSKINAARSYSQPIMGNGSQPPVLATGSSSPHGRSDLKIKTWKDGGSAGNSGAANPPVSNFEINSVSIDLETNESRNYNSMGTYDVDGHHSGTGNGIPVSGSGTTAKSESRMEQSSSMGENSTQIDLFFADLKFELAGLPFEQEQEFVRWITAVGGEVMLSDYQGTVDYLITPLEESGHVGKLKHKVHLTDNWVYDCSDQGELVPIQYYHYPIKKQGIPHYKKIVTCVSGYGKIERDYINKAISLLGGIPQKLFAKREMKDKGVLVSTHLVCKNPKGLKYGGALDWGVPVVTKDWVQACLKEWNWISEEPFLLGNKKQTQPETESPIVSKFASRGQMIREDLPGSSAIRSLTEKFAVTPDKKRTKLNFQKDEEENGREKGSVDEAGIKKLSIAQKPKPASKKKKPVSDSEDNFAKASKKAKMTDNSNLDIEPVSDESDLSESETVGKIHSFIKSTAVQLTVDKEKAKDRSIKKEKKRRKEEENLEERDRHRGECKSVNNWSSKDDCSGADCNIDEKAKEEIESGMDKSAWVCVKCAHRNLERGTVCQSVECQMDKSDSFWFPPPLSREEYLTSTPKTIPLPRFNVRCNETNPAINLKHEYPTGISKINSFSHENETETHETSCYIDIDENIEPPCNRYRNLEGENSYQMPTNRSLINSIPTKSKPTNIRLNKSIPTNKTPNKSIPKLKADNPIQMKEFETLQKHIDKISKQNQELILMTKNQTEEIRQIKASVKINNLKSKAGNFMMTINDLEIKEWNVKNNYKETMLHVNPKNKVGDTLKSIGHINLWNKLTLKKFYTDYPNLFNLILAVHSDDKNGPKNISERKKVYISIGNFMSKRVQRMARLTDNQ